MIDRIKQSLDELDRLNSGRTVYAFGKRRHHRLRKVLVANRGEIAKRFFLALREEGIPSVAVVAEVDRLQSWIDTADELISIGETGSYVNIPLIIAAALRTGANAIYPGYGFLSENADFVEAVQLAQKAFDTELIFMGPDFSIMRRAGNKLDARRLALTAGVPVFPGTEKLQGDTPQAEAEAGRIGYPVILKLDAGGGGKGMAIVREPGGLSTAIQAVQRIGRANYNNDSFYMERFIDRPVHFEVQIFNGSAIGVRKCAVQRRNQKVIEESGDVFLDDSSVGLLLGSAEKMAEVSGYSSGGGAGTVEFLFDADRNEFGFLEMNTRLQVEYAVTDASLGIDLVKWQIWQFDGRAELISAAKSSENGLKARDHAIQCRIYAEDAFSGYSPAPGHIGEIILPSFNAIRCDFGFQSGDEILPDYDPLIGKLIAHGSTREEALVRLQRALSEIHIRGVITNVDQLLRIVRHPEFRNGDYTNRLLDDFNELSDLRLDSEFRVEAALFGAMILHYRERNIAVRETIPDQDIRGIADNPRNHKIPSSFVMECCDESIEVDFLQTDLNSFHARVDRRYAGTLEVFSFHNDGIRAGFGGRNYAVSADIRPNSLIILRMTETTGRINYYRVKNISAGEDSNVDPPGMVRSPFRGSFVKICEDENSAPLKTGSRVCAGQPVIIISAMKMETTIHSNSDGILGSLLDDGDLSRLILGHTPAGLIRGRSIDEAEVLFVVEPEIPGILPGREDKAEREYPASQNFLDHLGYDTLSSIFERDIRTGISHCLEMVRASILGLFDDNISLDNIGSLLSGLTDAQFKEIEDAKFFAKNITAILLLSSKLKIAFSPALTSNLARAGDGLFRYYGEHLGSAQKREALFYMLRGLRNINRHASLFTALARIMKAFPGESGLAMTLSRLIQIEESEGHMEVAQEYRTVLKVVRPGGLKDREGYLGFNRKFTTVFREFKRDPCILLGVKRELFYAAATVAIDEPYLVDLPHWLPERVRLQIESKLEFLGRDFEITSLPAGNEGLVLFGLRKPGLKTIVEFLCFAYPHEGRIIEETNDFGEITGSPNLENSLVRSAALLTIYMELQPGAACRLEIACDARPTRIDLSGSDPAVWNYSNLTNIAHSVLPFFINLDIRMLTMDLDIIHPTLGITERKQLYFYMKNGHLGLALFQPEDVTQPYYIEQSQENSRLYERGKWPVEIWARECLDPASLEEIKIPSIDGNPEASVSVGAKIFRGKIAGFPALMFMKDSRVAGGATGDREGRKFAAAAYLAYLSNTPLYVWNDGAGANIKQGMVALNRAAEGFMMNSLIAEAATRDRFHAYTRNCADPAILSLFEELDGIFSLDNRPGKDRPENVFLVAVGIGSSTGLDVYGSSQASIQIMLDSEISYRVLTGSNVVRSVTGEDLTNYELGGARIMGWQTGVVDLIADDKLQLLLQIRSIQELFSRTPGSDAVKINKKFPAPAGRTADVLTEDLIKIHSDTGRFLAFKASFKGSDSLIGGFTRIAGQPILVMGPRNKFGCATLPAAIRAKELLQIARKTGSHRILVYGKTFLHSTSSDWARTERTIMDFTGELNRAKGLAVHIVTDPYGFDLASLNSAADVIIYVNSSADSSAFARAERTAAFSVESIDQAFSLSRKLIEQLVFRQRSVCVPGQPPVLSGDTALPFDMEKDIIERVFDQNSFLEYFAQWRDMSVGSSLITGVAHLSGRSVAVIADQPARGLAPDSPGTEKFRVFMEFVSRRGLPLVMLSSAPGFTPGAKQERLRIQQIGGESLDVNILSQNPVVSVVLNQNYGGRQIHAFSKFLRPGIVYISLERSILAVMGGSAAFDLFKGKEYAQKIEAGDTAGARELMERFIGDFNTKSRADRDAAGTGLMDRMLPDVAGLRPALIESLAIAEKRANQAFGVHSPDF